MNIPKRKAVYCILAAIAVVAVCAAAVAIAAVTKRSALIPEGEELSSADEAVVSETSEELRAIWIPYYSELDITPKKIDGMVEKCRDCGFNAIMFHVRAFGDAMYESDVFPWSHIACGAQGEAPANDFDPLAYIIEKAHENGMELHAWINPLRIQFEGGTCPKNLSPDNPYCVWRGDDNAENDAWVVDYNGGKYYNPAFPEVRQLIADGISEIVERYDVDGIHWDDYFYPAEDESFGDGEQYEAFIKAGGQGDMLSWRTDNINLLVRQSYAAVKELRPDCVFGISPAGNIDNCLHAGADVYEWCSHAGYIDYICPQVYWPFESEVAPFDRRCLEWRDMIKTDGIRFYVGLALYKGGSPEADSGLWSERDDIIAEQIEYCRSDVLDSDGYMVFAYDDLLSEQAAAECRNMIRANLGEYTAASNSDAVIE